MNITADTILRNTLLDVEGVFEMEQREAPHDLMASVILYRGGEDLGLKIEVEISESTHLDTLLVKVSQHTPLGDEEVADFEFTLIPDTIHAIEGSLSGFISKYLRSR